MSESFSKAGVLSKGFSFRLALCITLLKYMTFSLSVKSKVFSFGKAESNSAIKASSFIDLVKLTSSSHCRSSTFEWLAVSIAVERA